MNEDVKWFFGLIGIFFLLWVGAGLKGAPSTERPFIRPIPEGGGTYGEDPFEERRTRTRNSERITSPTVESVSDSIEEARQEAERLQQELEDFKKYSTLRNTLTLHRYRSARGGDPNSEQLLIRASSRNTGPILLSGLTIKSVITSNAVTIGKGTVLIIPGSSVSQDSVYLPPGGLAYISTGYSPVGNSFLLNACTGYFEQNNNFEPSLPRQCPRIEDEPLPAFPNQLTDQCLDYIEDIGTCVNPSIPVSLDSSCKSWIANEVGYNSCVNRHRNDTDFYKNEWRIYLNRSQPLWKESREHLQLLDTVGKVISEITY